MQKKRYLYYFGFFCLVLAVVVSFHCDKEADNVAQETNAFAPLIGTWTGRWVDTVFNLSGDISVTFTREGDTMTGTGTIDLSAFGLGSISGTGTGNIDGDSMTFTFNAGGLGNGTGTITDGRVDGNGQVTGTLSFGPFTFVGATKSNELACSFQYTNQGGGSGTVRLYK